MEHFNRNKGRELTLWCTKCNTYYSFQMQNEYNIKSTNIRSTTIIHLQNMNLKLNMKDINKILAKSHFKCNIFKWCEETAHYCRNMSLWSCWKSPCFLQVWWALIDGLNLTGYYRITKYNIGKFEGKKTCII